MLPKAFRLAKKKDFDSVFKKGQHFKEGFLILRIAANKKDNSRFGIIVSQKVAKKATARNRIKRQIRAVIRPWLPQIKKRADVVLIALPGLIPKDFSKTEAAIIKLFKTAKLI